MRRYADAEIRRLLRDGMKYVSPIYDKPSRGFPFRAIIEAAGIPGGPEGKGRVSRKRFVRLVMSTGNGKRAAEALAQAAKRKGISYRECLQRIMVPAILQADKDVKDLQDFIREINTMHKAVQEPYSESEEHGQDVPGLPPV